MGATPGKPPSQINGDALVTMKLTSCSQTDVCLQIIGLREIKTALIPHLYGPLIIKWEQFPYKQTA